MIEFSPYFDQNPTLSRPVKRMVVDADCSPPYELDASALFELENGAYVVIHVSGCSCWPDRGYTTVYEAKTAEQAIADAIKGERYADSPRALKDKWALMRVQGGDDDA